MRIMGCQLVLLLLPKIMTVAAMRGVIQTATLQNMLHAAPPPAAGFVASRLFLVVVVAVVNEREGESVVCVLLCGCLAAQQVR